MVRQIQQSENPNAVCAICRIRSDKLVTATHEVSGRPTKYHRYFACEYHAERAERSERLTAESDKHRKQEQEEQAARQKARKPLIHKCGGKTFQIFQDGKDLRVECLKCGQLAIEVAAPEIQYTTDEIAPFERLRT